jgi:hypothetical protein
MALQTIEPRPYRNPVFAKFLVTSSQFLNSSVVPFYLMKKGVLADSSGGLQPTALLKIFVNSSTTQFTSTLDFRGSEVPTKNILLFLREMISKYGFYFPRTLQSLHVPADALFIDPTFNEGKEIEPFKFTELRSFSMTTRCVVHYYTSSPNADWNKFVNTFVRHATHLKRLEISEVFEIIDEHFTKETFENLKSIEYLNLSGTRVQGTVFENGCFDSFLGNLKELDLSECYFFRNLEGLELASENLRVLRLSSSSERINATTFLEQHVYWGRGAPGMPTNKLDEDKSPEGDQKRAEKFFKPLACLRGLFVLDLSDTLLVTFDRFKNYIAESEFANQLRELYLPSCVMNNNVDVVLKILGEKFPRLEILRLPLTSAYQDPNAVPELFAKHFEEAFNKTSGNLKTFYHGLQGFESMEMSRIVRAQCPFVEVCS